MVIWWNRFWSSYLDISTQRGLLDFGSHSPQYTSHAGSFFPHYSLPSSIRSEPTFSQDSHKHSTTLSSSQLAHKRDIDGNLYLQAFIKASPLFLPHQQYSLITLIHHSRSQHIYKTLLACTKRKQHSTHSFLSFNLEQHLHPHKSFHHITTLSDHHSLF